MQKSTHTIIYKKNSWKYKYGNIWIDTDMDIYAHRYLLLYVKRNTVIYGVG